VAVWLVTYKGTFPSMGEEFQHTLAVDEPALEGGTPFTSDQASVADFARDSLVSAFNTLLSTHLSSSWVYTGVAVAQVLDLSLGTLSAATRRDVTPVLTGTSGDRPLPPQCAVRVSLKAGTYANGTPIRGGFYLPGPPGGLGGGTDGRMIDSHRDAFAAFAAQLVGDFNAELEGTTPVVWSRKQASTSAVTELRVGKAVDTIRSRRGKVPEDYKTFTF